jgi:2-keto-4-pentenoate hydratase/2-oxohepta-3-ene-1,7-dioic acid hydratase in catechol pathway
VTLAHQPFFPTERRVRLAVNGLPEWGRREAGGIVLESGDVVAESEATYLAPATPTKIIAPHLTYRSRVAEFGEPVAAEPSYFMKPPSALSGHLSAIPRPGGGRFLNYEGEVACVIGRRMKGVAIEEALTYVAGYTCANDVGLHDFRHADANAMLRVKGQDGFLPMGPELVPAADWDPTSYTLRTYLNGELVQEAGAGDLLRSFAYLLADVCRLITLEPGDVVLTGTPANSRPMAPNDVVEVDVTGLGRLRNTVVDWAVDLSGPGAQMRVTADTVHTALAVPLAEAERIAQRESRGTTAQGPRNGCTST